MERLPIDDALPELIEHLSSAGAVVLKAEPGAGKTTRVPPAILDAGLADLPNKRPGQIVVIQPRRVAARAAAARMSEERGTELGADIGYRVRHEGRTSKNTRITVCTEGILLRRLQEDPMIENIAVVIFDEFHERSVDSDLALALTMQVRQELRPDLRIVVMSATLDPAPITNYLGGCPAVESPGRTFPIAVEYLQFSSNASLEQLASDGVKQTLTKTSGNVLVFLPGVGEIRKTQTMLQTIADGQNLALMPLYGDMSLAEQIAVLRPCSQRKVVLATNVAETSLTIDGIGAVVDSGFARVNRFDPTLGINRLELTRISKASATQRAGRAGRTAEGACLRLWTEREHMALAEFELPEIERLDLSECVLQLLAWGENDVHAFPWFEKPPALAIDRALELLDRLDAISAGKLTELGRAMARFPLQPRLARLLIEGARLGQGERAALCAAVLSERPPFRRSDDPFAKATHHTDSDVLAQMHAIEMFESDGYKDSIMGEILPGPARQILRSRSQLSRLLKDTALDRDDSETSETESSHISEQDWAISGGKQAATNVDNQRGKHDEKSKRKNGDKQKIQNSVNENEAILRAIMTAFPDRICKRRQPKEPRGVMVGGRGVSLSEQSTVYDAELFAAVDMVDLNRAELSVRRASGVERAWLPASHLSTSIDVVYDSTREKVVAWKRTRFCDLILDETISSIPAEIDSGAVLAEAVKANFDINSLVDDAAKDYLNRVLLLQEWLPELEWPQFESDNLWESFLPEWCFGCTSITELRSRSIVSAIQSKLNRDQIASLEREAPEHMTLSSGRRVKLQYENGKPPVLAARIQELFGVSETPRVARGRVSVMMHLLAPNYRVQQITPDLNSFWKNTYPEVKKELKGRYPKHKWPDDPMKP